MVFILGNTHTIKANIATYGKVNITRWHEIEQQQIRVSIHLPQKEQEEIILPRQENENHLRQIR
jgi:hypothetical protein